MTTLVPPTASAINSVGISFYFRDLVQVAFSKVVGNDVYYFASSEEFNRLKPDAYVVSDFRVTDLTYDFVNEDVQVVDRNVRIPSGYMIVRPWYPAGSLDLDALLSVYPNSKSVW